MARGRDYSAEYARRKARAAEKGTTPAKIRKAQEQAKARGAKPAPRLSKRNRAHLALKAKLGFRTKFSSNTATRNVEMMSQRQLDVLLTESGDDIAARAAMAQALLAGAGGDYTNLEPYEQALYLFNSAFFYH